MNMSKGGHSFGDHASMGMYMRQLQGKINRTPWETIDFSAAVDQLAEVHTDLDFAHPFREGNGRASRVFMMDLASEHGIELDFSLVDGEQWNQASAETFLDPAGLRLTSDPFKAVYREVASPSEESSSLTGEVGLNMSEELTAAMQFGKDACGTEITRGGLSYEADEFSLDDNGADNSVDYNNDYGQGLDL